MEAHSLQFKLRWGFLLVVGVIGLYFLLFYLCSFTSQTGEPFLSPEITYRIFSPASVFTDELVNSLSSNCDYSLGGGSMNLCENDKLTYGFLSTFFLIFTFLFFFVVKKRRNFFLVKDFLIGVFYVIFLIPINAWMLVILLKPLFDKETSIQVLFCMNILILLLLSIKGNKHALKKEYNVM